MNEEVLTEAYSHSKKDAKKRAGEEGLKLLLAKDKMALGSHVATHFDKMAHLAREVFQQKLREFPGCSQGYQALAAFIIKTGAALLLVSPSFCKLIYSVKRVKSFYFFPGQDDPGKVVSIATGEGFVSTDKLRNDGRILIDTSAIVVARRAFLKSVPLTSRLLCILPVKSELCPGPPGTCM